MPKQGDHISKEDRLIDLDFVEHGIKTYFSASNNYSIRFFSAGEATVAFNRMVEIYAIAKQNAGKHLQVELQTNGYFSDEVADWIERNVNILWISLDGPPQIHDAQRPTAKGLPSSPVILNNVKRFAENKTMQFGVRATILEENFNKQIELIDYFNSLGIKFVCVAPAYSSEVNQNVSTPKLLKFAEGFVPAYLSAKQKDIFYQTHLMVNFDEKVNCYCRSCTTPPSPQLTSDGYVSCCDWASFGPKYLPGVLQDCVYGKWDIFKKRIEYFEDKKRNIENRNSHNLVSGSCKGCDIINHCAGGCIGKIIVQSGALHKKDPNWCEAVKYLKKHLPESDGLFPVLHS